MVQDSSLPLPMLLLLLLPLHLGAAPQTVKVNVSSVVRGLLGTDVQLPCHLVPGEVEIQVSQVTWLRHDKTSGRLSIAVFHPTHGAGFPSTGPGAERLTFVSQNQGPGSEFHDATLLIRDLRAEDETNYTCEFATFPGGNSKGTTELRVLAEPKNRAEAYEVTLGPAPMTLATCVSTGGRPPARISWLSPLADQSNETRTAGPVPDTFTVTRHFTLVPTAQVNEQNITCKVEHETLRKPALLTIPLVVRYSPKVSISRDDENWYVGQKEVSLNCDAQSNPKPTDYNWSTISGSLPSTAVSEGPKLIINSVDWSVNTTFICQVTNAVGTGRANQTIHVEEPPSSKKTVLPAVIIVVTVVVTLCILGYCLYTRRCPCQDHRNYSPNVEISYTSVACATSPPKMTQNSVAGGINQNGGQTLPE
ncbi:nectin-2-like [Dromiciops gliroides]|uniref:nectin-2-like n=1 Tax=Dromiciops gliroides TaxID=33562 RepID=UPI001CC4FDA7|nr:nectin-2-like [Dromiciops gliroides]